MTDTRHKSRDLLDRPQVAAKLKITVQKFMRSRDELAELGFPPPVLGTRAGERWDPEAIDRWLDLRMPAELRLQPSFAGVDDPYGALLDQRAKHLATARH